MAEQTHNRDMSDEPDREELEDRIDELEATIKKMLPGRRDALKLGGAALLGGAAMSGTASAGTSSTGTIGTANDPVDVVLEDATGVDTINGDNIVTVLDGTNETGDYQVQKDGADTTGVINFKTA
jgi:hypothetical protein